MREINSYFAAVFLPITRDYQMTWSPVCKWLKKPLTLIILLAVHALVISNYFRHRQFVLRVYESWEKDGGVISGTSLSASNELLLIGGLCVQIPISIMFIAATGVAPQIIYKETLRDFDEFFNELRPWILTSQIWVVWLVIMNAILFRVYSPVPGFEFGYFGALIGVPAVVLFPLVLFFYVAGWIGLAIPAVVARASTRVSFRVITILMLSIGLLLAGPLVLGHLLVYSPKGPLVASPMNFFEALIFCGLSYIILMMILLKLWLRLVTGSFINPTTQKID